MTDQPPSQPQPSSPPPTPPSPTPSAATPLRKKEISTRATIVIVFVFTLFTMTMLGVAQSLLAENGQYSPKTFYLPLGCILSAGLGWLVLAKLTKGTYNRLHNAVYWAGICMVGFAVAELATFGTVSEDMGSRVAFWSMFGAIIGMLSTPRKPVDMK